MFSKEKWRGALSGGLILMLAWYLLALMVDLPIIPSPVDVFIQIGEIFRTKMAIHVVYSLSRILEGMAISILIGVPLGFLMGYFDKWDRIFSPLMYFAYPIPKIALLPIIMVLFGLGEASKIIMIVLIIIFQIIITARDAVKDIPAQTFYSLQSLGAGRLQIFTEIVAPAALPEVLTATRLALGTAISILFFTETFGTQYGMGFFIMDSWLRVNYLDMYAGIVVLSFIGFCLFVSIDYLERKICSWR
ncbi:MAG TPA: ABC transporter permease [Syntrophomonas sp.]|jgi:NitT/TauT family transport system permease protein|nr:ABC transporter permease [Syntrophomonas sp.]